MITSSLLWFLLTVRLRDEAELLECEERLLDQVSLELESSLLLPPSSPSSGSRLALLGLGVDDLLHLGLGVRDRRCLLRLPLELREGGGSSSLLSSGGSPSS